MNDLNLSSDSRLPTAKPASRWKKATLAGILSLFIPGMGQLVNHQPRKALALGLMMYAFRLLQVHTHWMLSFGTMMGAIAAALVLQLGVAVEAAYSAGRGNKEEAAIPLARVSYAAIGVLLLAGVIFPTSDQAIRKSGFGAFRVASGSMCPTICQGERVVANRNAYQSTEPEHGDVILVKHASSEGPFLKRIIGLPGDVITQGPEGTVLVNGTAFHPPAPCGRLVWKGPSPPTCPMCGTVVVEPGEYFVVGDDLTNSFDSRYKEFGPVTREMLVGKVLFIAWSASWSRIGCTVK
jgi:signal peptidase I